MFIKDQWFMLEDRVFQIQNSEIHCSSLCEEEFVFRPCWQQTSLFKIQYVISEGRADKIPDG